MSADRAPAGAVGLVCERLSKTYDSRNGAVEALSDVSLAAQPGEFVVIVGPSGCGKSTLLKIVAGLVPATSGRVRYPDSRSGKPRNALVFQEHGLFPWLNVADNVAFGLEAMGVARAARLARAQGVLDLFGLSRFARHFPHELSVGMRQRAALARAFLTDPDVLLMDEPFSSLDAQTKLILQEELLRIWGDRTKTVIYVTHDIDEAVRLGDRVLVMSGRPGRITEDIIVPLSRPRSLEDSQTAAAAQIKWHIWKAIESDARRAA